MNLHTFLPILSSSRFPIHLLLSRRFLSPPLKQAELVRRFVLPAKYYNHHYTLHIHVHIRRTLCIRRTRFYSFKRRINARSIACSSQLAETILNHLNPWKPNNSSRFPMFIPWTMATSTSSSLVTYLYNTILPKQISHPCRRIKSPRPGNLGRERSRGRVLHTGDVSRPKG